MRVEKIICDYCGKEIPKVKKDVFGIEKEFYKFGTLKYMYPFEVDCYMLGMDLCERCAESINLSMYEMRMKYVGDNR